eukprot:7885353-Pyramimonas_sp.AAC.1
MKTPTEADMMDLKRFGRYFKHARAGSPKCTLQLLLDRVDAHVDADWAGEATTRKSRTGMMLMMGSN